ncbi:hypothetical protein VCHA53O466_40274 [Vibrio chagasii]|nr:hypothetical protein VCHA53O466_40274 [Vibrio chagasii]
MKLNSRTLDFVYSYLELLTQGDLGECRLALSKYLSIVITGNLDTAANVIDDCLPYAQELSLNLTLSAQRFYLFELLRCVRDSTLSEDKVADVLMEMSVFLKFNAFRVAMAANKYDFSEQQWIKMVSIGEYE